VSTIVTFYSYKGGVGRSMALANVAVLLARRGLRVLAVDWDLEAPGIENYFSYFKMEAEGPGLLSMLMKVAEGGTADYKNYIWPVRDEERTISLLSSGRATDSKYSANLERFNWEAFFAKGGGEFLESLRERWRSEFDVTLIDSRTGLSDAGGICTIQLPDIIVAMFTTNHQSLYGVRDVMRLAQTARDSLAHDRPQLSIVPLGSRFGNDFKESKTWLDRASEAMSEFYRDWLPTWANTREVIDQLKIPQIDYFGYGEKLAVVEQGTTDPQGMGFTFEKIANLLASDLRNAEEVFQLSRPQILPEIPAKRKDTALRQSPARDYEYDLYVSYEQSSLLNDRLRPFVARLEQYISEMQGQNIRIFLDYREVQAGSVWQSEVANALSKSKLLLAVITPRYFRSKWAVAEWKTFEEREARMNVHPLIFPVVFYGPGKQQPEWFRSRLYFDMQHVFDQNDSIVIDRAIQKLAEEISWALENSPRFADGLVISPDDVDSQPPDSIGA
jgi:MinD-like ATPase involved in chromosome partitioning or flagellar assembly